MIHGDFETTTIYLAEHKRSLVAGDLIFRLTEHTVQVILGDDNSFICWLPETVHFRSQPTGDVLSSDMMDKELSLCNDPIHKAYYSKNKEAAMFWLKRQRATLIHDAEFEYSRAIKSEIEDFTETQTIKM